MNKLLKHWQSYKKIDLYAFAKEYEELVQCQELDILKAYLGLRGPYEVREEFKKNMRNFNTDYASLSAPEKAKVKELLLNVAVEPKAYTSIMKFKASDVALDNTRRITKNNVMKRFQQESKEVGDQIVFQRQDDVNCFNLVNEMVEESDHNEFNLNATEFLLQEALPNQSCENIRSSILKSFELISNSHIIPGFGNNQYLVKSYSRLNDPPHFVSVRNNGSISCDNNCPKCNKEGFCGHTIGVALKCKLVEKYASALSKCQERTVTQLASQNINPSQVGRKRP